MGSGGMIVMDDSSNMVNIANFYLDFTVDESCGKCAPCRIGGKQMLLLLEKINKGKGTKQDLEDLKRVAQAMQKLLCAALVKRRLIRCFQLCAFLKTNIWKSWSTLPNRQRRDNHGKIENR